MTGGLGGRGGSGGIQEVVQASPVLNHFPPPSKNFQGRQAILNEMHQFFAENTGVEHIYVLYGLGGVGKTQIALKVIADSTAYVQVFSKGTFLTCLSLDLLTDCW
ncbi:hypothetical protein K438DRAFT_1157568 [Mycena galopus ATCC 62051]|nr:hypothetical protein K438DRAFT_1157568 [Mycena galopus ATCC 62051]